MATIRAFRAERPPKDKAAAVSAVPYDVVNTAEARRLAEGNPLSFLHVSRPEIDLPDGADIYADEVYAKAKENYEQLRRSAPLEVEATPSLYVYRQRMGEHEQTGLAACCSVDEYDTDIIRKHERTRKDKEDDRTRHMITIGAQTGPVFMAYRGRDTINAIVERTKQSDPIADFTADDGVSHTIWRVSDEDAQGLIEEFKQVPLLYIADGHHRAASASRARAALRDQNSNHTGDEEYNYFLAVLFPADEVQILPYNRVVKDLNSQSTTKFLDALSKRFKLSEEGPEMCVMAVDPRTGHKYNAFGRPEKGIIRMYLNGKWYLLGIADEAGRAGDPIASLDVSVLQERVLDPLLGIKDVRTDKRIDFVGGIRGAEALEQAVNEGRAAVAFELYPVTVEELMAIADANEIMPPKSTWFEPKLRDGLLSHLIG
ncbi:MAG TPA: DUF1015 family protein [Blastocatellia bacterium]|nr:DUF1015 family protein [Blastocatellia bacterium]